MAVGIKDRIEKIKLYFISFNVIASEDAAYVLLNLPEKWTIPDQVALKENYKVEIAIRQEGTYFMTEISNGTDCLFDAVDYVITFNKNVEERKSLLSIKIKELTELFATETLDKLKKMTFVLPSSTDKQPKATKREKVVKIDKISSAKKVTTKDIESTVNAKFVTDKEKEEKSKKQNNITVLTNNDNDLMSLAKGLTGE